MPTENPSEEPVSETTNATARVRILPETKDLLKSFCDEFGVDPDAAIRDLLSNYQAIRSGGFGGELGHALAELSVLETLVGGLNKTNLLILAELRNLQAAHYASIAAKMR
jgi:hypothetical protein